MMDRFPFELTCRRQWLIAGADKVPRLANGNCCSVHDVASFMTFEEAVAAADARGWNVGYVLTADDPYACIDLDVKDASNCNDPELFTTVEEFDRYKSIINELNSYTEVSQSGKGVHIWVKLSVSCADLVNKKRRGVEVYVKQRFIICTGHVMHNLPVGDRTHLVLPMLSQMTAAEGLTREWIDEDVSEDDWSVLARLSESDNREKFLSLFEGDWSGYPSQSEADIALMSMFCFHSNNNEQCRRLFRDSGLGKRDKATKNDAYLNRTLRLIRNRQLNEREEEVLFSAALNEQAKLVAQEVTKLQGGIAPTVVNHNSGRVVEFAPVGQVSAQPQEVLWRIWHLS